VLASGRRGRPKCRKPLTKSHDLRPQASINTDGLGRGGGRGSRQRFFRAPQFDESGLPSPLKLTGNEPVVRIDAVELTLGECSLIAEPLNLLLLGMLQGFIGSSLSLAST
jgi:hypothetical protein